MELYIKKKICVYNICFVMLLFLCKIKVSVCDIIFVCVENKLSIDRFKVIK